MENRTFNQVWDNIGTQLYSLHRQKIDSAKAKFAKEKEDDKHNQRN
jgi:hypothetical protein